MHLETKNHSLVECEADNLIGSFLSKCKVPDSANLTNTEAILYLQRLKKFFFEFMDYCNSELKSPHSCKFSCFDPDRKLAIDSVSNLLESVDKLLRSQQHQGNPDSLGPTCSLVSDGRLLDEWYICY